MSATAGTVSPTIVSSSFLDSTDPWGAGSNVRSLVSHIHLYATGAGKAKPNISACQILSAAPTATVAVFYGVYLRAVSSGDVSPTIQGCEIGSGGTPTHDDNGMRYGVDATAVGGGKTNFKLRNSTVHGCKKIGVDVASGTANQVVSSPAIYNCTIEYNGWGASTSARYWENRTESPSGGHGIRVWAQDRGQLAPTIRNNSPETSGRIANNWVDGVHIVAEGGGLPGGTTNTRVDQASVRQNDIFGNGRCGVTGLARSAVVKMSVEANKIHANAQCGVLGLADDPAASENETAYVESTLFNNRIFGTYVSGQPGTATQLRGVWNERTDDGGQARLREVHDPVAQNYIAGISNVDPSPGGYNAPYTYVENSISWYNRPNGVDLQGFAPSGQIRFNDYLNAQKNYGSTNIRQLPKFKNRLSYDFHLLATPPYNGPSPCIDRALNSPRPFSPPTDFEGDPRVIDFQPVPNYFYVGTMNCADMGADEVTDPPPPGT
ncbi:MAG: hypothetical protein AB1486_11460 [Planctomycetota bacterium]